MNPIWCAIRVGTRSDQGFFERGDRRRSFPVKGARKYYVAPTLSTIRCGMNFSIASMYTLPHHNSIHPLFQAVRR